MTTSNETAIKDLAEASAYLEGLINHERRPEFAYIRLDLRPIRALLDRLGRPEESLSVIHVAGSKGKGSTCLFVEAILTGLGERVGCFTSPHLESWTERFRINGKPIDEVRLVQAVQRVRPIVEDLKSGPRETLPSFFDATTAVAFLLFAEAGVDRAVIEVGLGGRLDSTNVVDPVVTCITSIELEHTDKLGETEAEIAGEKAGILKSKCPVVIGSLRADAERVIRARAAELDAHVIAHEQNFAVESVGDELTGNSLIYRSVESNQVAFECRARLHARGQAAIGNAGLAIACVRALGIHSDEALARAADEALAQCRLPGRIEILENDPEVIVDAAHTAESVRTLANALTPLAPAGVDLILSISTDKNLGGLLQPLLPLVRRVWITQAEPTRSVQADLLAKSVRALAPGLPMEIVFDPVEAARRARAALPTGRRLCAAGSVYLAGIVRRVLNDRVIMMNWAIELARPDDVPVLPGIELRAAQLFSAAELAPGLAAETTPIEDYEDAQRDGRLIVARDAREGVVGFAHLIWVGEFAHLEEVDVEPDFARRGIGRGLVEAACDWARRHESERITLSTFRDVAWNAPFYESAGFVAIVADDLSPALCALREHEKHDGLDPTKRIMMSRTLTQR